MMLLTQVLKRCLLRPPLRCKWCGRRTLIIREQILTQACWVCEMDWTPFVFSSQTVLMGMLITDKVNLFVLYSLITNYKLHCLPSPQARHLRRCQAIKVLKTVITVKYTTKIKSLHMIFSYAWFCSLHLLNHNSCLMIEQESLNW